MSLLEEWGQRTERQTYDFDDSLSFGASTGETLRDNFDGAVSPSDAEIFSLELTERNIAR